MHDRHRIERRKCEAVVQLGKVRIELPEGADGRRVAAMHAKLHTRQRSGSRYIRGVDPLDRYLDANRERLTDELRDLCRIPSETGDAAALDAAALWCAE